jgi:hypothetical protein
VRERTSPGGNLCITNAQLDAGADARLTQTLRGAHGRTSLRSLGTGIPHKSCKRDRKAAPLKGHPNGAMPGCHRADRRGGRSARAHSSRSATEAGQWGRIDDHSRNLVSGGRSGRSSDRFRFVDRCDTAPTGPDLRSRREAQKRDQVERCWSRLCRWSAVIARRQRDTQRKPIWLIEVSIASGWRAAGR